MPQLNPLRHTNNVIRTSDLIDQLNSRFPKISQPLRKARPSMENSLSSVSNTNRLFDTSMRSKLTARNGH